VHDAPLIGTPIWHQQRSVADSYFPGAHSAAIIVQDDLDDTYLKLD
jgi:hypothetical protein